MWRIVRRASMDGVLLSGSFVVAALVHFNGHVPETLLARSPLMLLMGVATMLFGLAWVRVHRKVSEFVSLGDFLGVLKGTSAACLVLLIANLTTPETYQLPWPLLVRYYVLATMAMSAALFTRRIWRETRLGQQRSTAKLETRTPILVYGAGKAGSAVAREFLQSPGLGYELRGFLDDDPAKWGQEILGIRVLGGRRELQSALGEDLREVVLAIPSLDAESRREILGHCRRSGAHVRIVPGLADLLRDGSYANQIREVRVEDLLEREAVELDETDIRKVLTGETVLVTGAAGSIGSELCHQILLHAPSQLLLVEQSESRLYYLEMELSKQARECSTKLVPIVADVCERDRIEAVFKTYRPSHIFHAAAYKHVPMMQRNPHEAIRNNVFATRTVAQLARQYQAKRFVLVSTDKAVEPTSVMGASKRAAELLVRELQDKSKTRFMVVRFGNVLDSDGSVVPLFRRQIKERGPITITHADMERFFMTIPEASRLILQATAMGQGGEVFVLEMGQPIRVLDLARSMVELSGLRFMEDIQVTFTGMRPGEKLTEKLFFDHEESVPTRSPHINMAQLAHGSRVDLENFIRTLEDLVRSDTDDRDLALRFMSLVAGLDAPRHVAPEVVSTRPSSGQVVPLPQVMAAKS